MLDGFVQSMYICLCAQMFVAGKLGQRFGDDDLNVCICMCETNVTKLHYSS